MGKKKAKSRSREWFERLVDADTCVFTAAMLDAMTSKEIGDLGESLAADYLYDHGFEIAEFNYRCPEGEADIVAYDCDADQLVLVEVKTRRLQGDRGDVYPEEAVTIRKQQRYRRIAAHYLMERFPVPALRFDVVAVALTPGHPASFEHVEGAFDWVAGR